MISIALNVTDSMLGSLRQTRPWVMFLSIMGFIFAGFAVLGGVWMLFAFSMIGAMPHHGDMPTFFGPLFGTVFGILYLGMALFLYLIPCIILFRYSAAIGRIADDGQTALEDALLRQKSFWKYMGILMIVMLALYVLFIIGGIVAAVVIGLHAAH